MYQVYSQQRPGRPRWAMAAGTTLLLLTVGFAWTVTQYKERAGRIALTESKAFPRGDLRCRLPDGWRINTGEDLPPRIVLTATEPTQGERRGRQLYVFRGVPRPVGLPSRDAVLAVSQIMQAVIPGSALKRAGPAHIGPLPGWNVEGIGMSPFGGGAEIYCLGRAAIAPQGQIVGLVLVIPEIRGREDIRLLEQVSETVELDHVRPAGQPQSVMRQAGIQFDPPTGTTFFLESIPKLARVQMMGGAALGQWFLDASRVPLTDSRTPAALVTDYVLNYLGKVDLPDPVETKKLGNRDLAQIAISPDRDSTLLVACVKTEEHTGLFFIGRHEPEGGRELSNVCQLIARTAEVGSYDGLMNISQARASARRQLEEIARRKLTADWSAQPQTQRYVIASPAVTRGTEVRTYKQRRQDNAVWWKVDMQMKLDSIESTESWLIRDDGEAHRGNYELAAAGVKYTEQRVEQDNQVRRELWVLPAGVRKSSTPVDDTYAPEVVLVHAAAKMALASDGAPGIFTAIDTFAVDTVRWIVVPLGRQPLPGGKTSDKAAAVLLQRDYGPSPIVLYFDEALTMVAVNHDNVHWQTLTGGSTREGVTE